MFSVISCSSYSIVHRAKRCILSSAMDNFGIQADSDPFARNSSATDGDCFRYDARFTDYEGFAKRLKSFENSQWSPVERRHLAAAGFFDAGRPDTIQCFYCGLRLALDGNANDDPWRDHARYVGNNGCAYLVHMKNKVFVRSKGKDMGDGGEATCFDRGGGESGWIPCKDMNSCRLCVWEFWMKPLDSDSDSDGTSD